MTSHSDAVNSRAGLTLLEVLVVLGILALTAALAFTSLRPPSDALLLSHRIAELERDFALDRLRAVREDRVILRDVSGMTCDDAGPSEIVFRPDGSAMGPDLCLNEGNAASRWAIDFLTGHLVEVSP